MHLGDPDALGDPSLTEVLEVPQPNDLPLPVPEGCHGGVDRRPACGPATAASDEPS